MKDSYGLLILIGIALIGFGIYVYKHPDFLWNISWQRRRYLKGGEPTELYYSEQKMRGVGYVILGAVMIILSISLSVTDAKGYVVKIDGNELKIPCTYYDIEALGYRVDASQEIKILQATSKNLKKTATYTVNNAEGKEFKVIFANKGDEDKIATECELIAIYVEAEIGPEIKLPNGVKNGMSESEVTSVMGRGTSRGVAGSAAEYNPKVNLNTYKVNVVYEGNFRDKRVKSIRVEDLIY